MTEAKTKNKFNNIVFTGKFHFQRPSFPNASIGNPELVNKTLDSRFCGNDEPKRNCFFTTHILLSLFLLFVSNLSAADIKPETITLEQVLEIVKENNPEIRAARKRWEASKTKPIQATTLENPQIEIERMYVPSDKNVISGADEKSTSIRQDIPFPTKLYFKHGIASKEVSMAEETYKAKVRNVLSRTRSTYAMLYHLHRALEIFNENIELMRRFARVAESKYAAGQANQSDALKAQVELTRMLNMFVVINEEKEIAEAMLNAVMGRDTRSPVRSPAPIEMIKMNQSLEELLAKAEAKRPELREATLASERASKSLKLARSEFIPDFMLQYRQRQATMTGRTNDGIFGFSVPLWFWKQSAMVREARAEKEMAEAELESMRVMTLSEVKSAFVRAKTSMRLVDIYKTSVLPQAEAALNVAESSYQTNKAGFLDLLDAQRSLLEFKLEYHQYISDYEQEMAELERVVGEEL